MKRIALGVALLASLGAAACAKAGAEAPRTHAGAQPAAVVSLSDGVVKAAMVEAGLTKFTGITVDLGDAKQKAAMAEAGVTNLTGAPQRLKFGSIR
jgi:hypothetical protein